MRRERARRGFTQEKLAELHLRTVQKSEGCHINVLITTAHRLQAALRCPWDSLMELRKE